LAYFVVGVGLADSDKNLSTIIIKINSFKTSSLRMVKSNSRPIIQEKHLNKEYNDC